MQRFPWNQFGLGLIGAALGATAGYFLYVWILGQGYDAGVLPGAAVGLGFGLLARKQRLAFGVVCGIIGTLFGFFCEWSHFPFLADSSLSYFVSHLHELPPIKLVMILIGGVLAFALGRGRTTDPFSSGER